MLERAVLVFVLVALGVLVTVPILVERRVGELREQVELREFPEPDLPPGAVLLETALSEVCGTDVHLFHGRLDGVPYPIIPGHVSVGRAAKVRGEVRHLDGGRLREGDRVAFFDVHRTCGRCHFCAVARTPTRCRARRVYGITDPASEGSSAGGPRRSTSSPASSRPGFPTPCATRTTSAAAAV